MYVNSKDRVSNPIQSPGGEIVYELIGAHIETGCSEKHSLAHVIIPSGKCAAAHHHNRAEECYYILSGVGRMKINGVEFPLTPGQACLIQPGETHQIFNDSELAT